MADKIRQTEITSGDIYFKIGNYQKRVNTKTASNMNYINDIINLQEYTYGEEWEQVSITYGIVKIEGNVENIQDIDISIKYLTDNKNQFKFVGKINGRDVSNNKILISWFAREEIIDVTGERFITPETHVNEINHKHTFNNNVKKVLNVSVNTGIVDSYNLISKNQLNINLRQATKYKTYSKPYSYNEAGKPGSYTPDQTKSVKIDMFQDDKLGTMPFSGIIKLVSNSTRQLPWYNVGAQYTYKSVTVSNNSEWGYSIGQVLDSSTTSDYATRTIVTDIVRTGGDIYNKSANIYATSQKADILRDCSWSGTLYCDTYVYVVNTSYIIDREITVEAKWIPYSAEYLFDEDSVPAKIGSELSNSPGKKTICTQNRQVLSNQYDGTYYRIYGRDYIRI